MISPRDASPTDTSKNLPRNLQTKTVLVVFGTRPEAIKLAPLISTLRTRYCTELRVVVCVTGQHREMLGQVLSVFDLAPDVDLNVMTTGQSLNDLCSVIMGKLHGVLSEVNPALTVVQGDTTTTLCGALASFHQRVPVAHVEAGLRTDDMHSPFPEEMNRVLTGRLATLHFAATKWAADNLLREGCESDRVWVTGNTGIDAVLATRDVLTQGRPSGLSIPIDPDKKLVLVTAHRRESFGEGFAGICNAVARLAERPEVQVIWPVHLNPSVKDTVTATLRDRRNVFLVRPLEYLAFVDLMIRAKVILTDSGGVQEEGPSLGKPILVLREKTERPEAIHAGTVKLVGTNSDRIVQETLGLLSDPLLYQRMAHSHNPYGDGKASHRISQHIASYLRQDSQT
jgi:UDP-N-acetylglucosamine 2-epimerase (non-hydrolysing)